MKDVKLPDNPARKTLLLEKHANYIEAFEKDKDDYVREEGREGRERGREGHTDTHIYTNILLLL